MSNFNSVDESDGGAGGFCDEAATAASAAASDDGAVGKLDDAVSAASSAPGAGEVSDIEGSSLMLASRGGALKLL